jgi:hypothetical protein
MEERGERTIRATGWHTALLVATAALVMVLSSSLAVGTLAPGFVDSPTTGWTASIAVGSAAPVSGYSPSLALFPAPELWTVPELAYSRLATAPDPEPGLDLAGATYLGPADLASAANPNGTVPMLISLNFTNGTALDELLAALSDPSSPEYHHYLTHDEFDEEFGGDPAVYSSLMSYLESFGVTALSAHPDRLALSFQATPDQIKSIFHTTLGAFQSPSGEPYYAPLSSPELPSPFTPYVSEVQGLSNYSEYLVHTDSAMATGGMTAGVGSAATGVSSSPARPSASTNAAGCSTACAPGGSKNPFTSTTVGGLTYDEPVNFTSTSNCYTTTCAQVLEGADLQVTYNETGLFSKYGYPVNATVVALLWTDLVHRGSTGFDGNSFCAHQLSSSYAWDFFMPDVTAYWNYTLPSGEPMPRAVSMPITGSSSYSYPSGSQGYSASCDSGEAEDENTLDVAMEGSLAPGANVFQVFGQGSSTTTISTAFSDILSPTSSSFSTTGGFDTAQDRADLNNTSVIANSWGGGSLGGTAAWVNDLKQAQTLGITVLASSGDSGDNSLEGPSENSYDTDGAVAVGGTSLVINATTLRRTADHLATMASPYSGVGGGEIVWYEPGGTTDGFGTTAYGSVGGVASASTSNAPTWQNNSADAHGIITGITSSNYGRGVPDISAVANDTVIDLESGVYSFNVTCWVSSSCAKTSAISVATTVTGTYFIGTSIADQVAGGEIATIDHALWSVDEGNIGFIDPAAYPEGQLQSEDKLTLHSFYGIALYSNSEPQKTYGAFSNRSWNAEDGWGTIDDGNYTQNTLTYAMTFTESGLPSGTNWSVTLTPTTGDANCIVSAASCSNGATKSSTTTRITFEETYGTYEFKLGKVNGSVSSPSNGTSRSAESPVDQGVSFASSDPPAPTAINATASSSSTALLSWTNPSGALTDNHIYAYYGGSCSGSTVDDFDMGAPATSYLWAGLPASSTYSWEVTASSAYGEGPPSRCAFATTYASPGVPKGLNATASSYSTVYLSWLNPSGTLTDNHIYAYYGGSCSGSTVDDFDMGSPATSYLWSGLPASSTYSWEVTASSSNGEGSPSKCAAATTSASPGVPTGLNATAKTYSTVRLAWTNPSRSITDNHIYAYYGGSCSGSTVDDFDMGSPATSYLWSGLPASSTYSWEVTASSSNGEGSPSKCAAATTFATPGTPTGVTATANNTSTVYLAWTNPLGTLTDNHIYAYYGGSCSGPTVDDFDMGSPATSYLWAGLPASSTYSWEVTASSAYGEGLPSTCISATTP